MKKPLVLAILDGYGLNDSKHGNAIYSAKKPNLDYLFANYPWTKLEAAGSAVGIPDGQFGNSEVGHLTIGAGRVVYTGLSLINKVVSDHELDQVVAFQNAFNCVKKHNSSLHIVGLLSPGGVHSHQSHIFELIKVASKDVSKVFVHVITDGRDVAPQSAIEYLNQLNEIIKSCPNVEIATIAGRFYSMDRDARWNRVERSYEMMLGGKETEPTKDGKPAEFSNVIDYVNTQYANGITDEFIEPACNKKRDGFIKDNDAVIFANFRPDRARELTHLLKKSSYYDFDPKERRKNLFVVSMMKYEGIDSVDEIAFDSTEIKMPLGEVLADNGLSQLRLAETEKYAHVTFFFDGGKEVDYKNEEKILVSSPKVETYDLAPGMSAREITDKFIENAKNFDVVIMNYANADMVGHTGIFEKAVESIEILDEQIGRLFKKIEELGGQLLITADHGNAEIMLDDKNNVVTKHTSSPVPFIITNKDIKFKNVTGGLSNVAGTMLDLLNIPVPSVMDQSLIAKKG